MSIYLKSFENEKACVEIDGKEYEISFSEEEAYASGTFEEPEWKLNGTTKIEDEIVPVTFTWSEERNPRETGSIEDACDWTHPKEIDVDGHVFTFDYNEPAPEMKI